LWEVKVRLPTVFHIEPGKISVKKRKGTLQPIHADDLNRAEAIYADLFNDLDNDTAPR
jgi:hypothetical protein